MLKYLSASYSHAPGRSDREEVYVVRLCEAERTKLTDLIRTGKRGAGRGRHAEMLLLADQGEEGPAKYDREIAQLGVWRTTVEGVRTRSRDRSTVLDGESEAPLTRIACSEPPSGQACWTLRLLRDELRRLKVVKTISHEMVRRGAKSDAECERNGVGHLLQYSGPFDDWRRIDVAANHNAATWADGTRRLVERGGSAAQRITLVMDNSNTHTGASLYKSFPPAQARALLDKLEFVYTPKHGSWLNLAACEFSVLAHQCLDRRIADIDTLCAEVGARTEQRNPTKRPVNWRFTTADARIKLRHLYPVI